MQNIYSVENIFFKEIILEISAILYLNILYDISDSIIDQLNNKIDIILSININIKSLKNNKIIAFLNKIYKKKVNDKIR